MNEETIKALNDRLMEDLNEITKRDIDPDEKKRLSEEIKEITKILKEQDSLNLEWEKFIYQKNKDLEDRKAKFWDRIFSLGSDILKIAGILISSGVTITLVKTLLMYETDKPITSRLAQLIFGRFINPRV